VDEYLLPHSSSGASSLSELLRGMGRSSPVYSFSNRWAAVGPGVPRTGVVALRDIAEGGVYADKEVVLGRRTKYVVGCKSKVVFVHIHKATTSTEWVRSATHTVSPKTASFLHFTNLDPCHGSVAVDDVLYEQTLLTSDPARRDRRFHQLMDDWRVVVADKGGGGGKKRAPAPAAGGGGAPPPLGAGGLDLPRLRV
jgi:hypothetical protein